MGSKVVSCSFFCFLFLFLCVLFWAADGYGMAHRARREEEEEEEESRRLQQLHSSDSSRSTANAWPGYLYTRAVGRCTPQFWSSGAEPWPNISPQEAAVSRVFGSRTLERYPPGLTLMEATMRTDDVGGSSFVRLVKQGSAALLNAYARRGFPFDSWEVKALLLEALVSEEAAAAQAERFEQANQSCT